MIVVDTSIWIDFLNGRDTPGAEALAEMIADNAPIALTGQILTEILRGLRDDAAALHVEGHLRGFPLIETDDAGDWSLAAKLFRDARREGKSIRNAADCVIAAPCIRVDAALMHDDADFDRLASVSDLRVYSYAGGTGVN